MVRAGMAWWYRKYAREQNAGDQVLYEAAEKDARKNLRGCGLILSRCRRGSGAVGNLAEYCSKRYFVKDFLQIIHLAFGSQDRDLWWQYTPELTWCFSLARCWAAVPSVR